MTESDRAIGLKGASKIRKIPQIVWNFIKYLRTGKFLGEDDGNPLRLNRKKVLWWCTAAILFATLFYIILIWSLTANLVKNIEQTSALYTILSESVIYPNDIPVPTDPSSNKVNDLAIFIWLRELKILRPSESLEDALADDGDYIDLANALRYGSKCNQKSNVRIALSLPDVQRLSIVAAYLAEPCKERGKPKRDNGEITESDQSQVTDPQARQQEVTNFIVDRIAGLDFGCGQSFLKNLMSCWTNLFGESKGISGQASIKSIFSTMSVYSGRNTKPEPSRKDTDTFVQLRQLIENVSSINLSDLDDTQIWTVNEFELALLSRINAQSEVVAARQWLTIFRGWEQCAILMLVFVLSTLLFMRFTNLRSQVYGTNRLLDHLKEEMKTDGRDKEKQVFANRLAKLEKVLELHKPRTSQVAEDLANAALVDLEALNTLGVVDEHTQSVANRMEKKLELSRAMMDWGIATLPALGFLGTVHGILNALQGVGGLSQGDSATRMATLVSVSGSLGLAFATTLLALAFMIPLSFFDARIARSERNLIMTTEEFFATKFLV